LVFGYWGIKSKEKSTKSIGSWVRGCKLPHGVKGYGHDIALKI